MRTLTFQQCVERSATDRLHQHIRNSLPHVPLLVVAAAIEHADEIFAHGAGSLDAAHKSAVAHARRLVDERVAA